MIRKSDPPGLAVASFWCNGEDIDKVLQKAPIEQDVCIQFVDLP